MWYKLKREMLMALNACLPRSIGVTNYGNRWRIPFAGRSTARLMRFGRDAAIAQTLSNMVPTPNLILDIGANVGQSLILYRSYFPNARYLGFEPNPLCSALVTRIIAENHLSNAAVITAGIAAQSGILPLHIARSHLDDPTASLHEGCHAQKDRQDMPVVVGPLRTWAPDLSIDATTIIKIDVEGYEADVLESLREDISGGPIIVLEVLAHWHDAKRRLELIDRITSWMKCTGYQALSARTEQPSDFIPHEENYILVPVHRTAAISAAS